MSPTLMFARSVQAVWLGLADVIEALRFLSRLPLPARANKGSHDLARALRWAPLAGVVIAAGPALVLVLGHCMHLPALAAAALAVAGLVIVSGALHEDGLADMADGFGGGHTRERKLAIMRDSRIGTFGALALGLSLILRTACLQSILDRGAMLAVAALVAAAVLSRGLMLVPMTLLPHARADGLARSAGSVSVGTLAAAILLGIVLAGLAMSGGHLSAARFVAAVALAWVAALGATELARRQIGGVTGDVVGATQQMCEIAVLLVLSAGPGLG